VDLVDAVDRHRLAVVHEVHPVHPVVANPAATTGVLPGRWYNRGFWSTNRMSEDRTELGSRSFDTAWPLYGAAFATGLSLSIAWTAMSFVLTAMGGTEAHVGNAPAVNSLAYMAALLITGSRLGNLNVKRSTRAATIVALLAAGLMALAVYGARGRHEGGTLAWVWLMIVAGGLGGAAMALFWPFLMSWVSARYEGVELNRRLGRYNGSWSSGGFIGPLIGAWLAGKDPLWPMLASVACFVVSFLLLGFARSDSARSRNGVKTGPARALACDARTLADFRWMSRIALFCGWACFAIMRSQFALVFTGPLGHSEGQFGAFMMTIALCNFLALISSGRWAFWHFRAPLLIGAQVLMLVAVLLVIYGGTLGILFLAAVVLGLAFGFAYSSHLYYGAAASRKRSVRMVIHEVTISVGVSLGAAAGGYFAKNVGPYAPYWFAVGLTGLGVAVQMMIHLAAQARGGAIEAPPATGGVGLLKP
jgi:MFS family permease